MAKRIKKPATRQYPIVIETFRKFSEYSFYEWEQSEPSVWNGEVSARRYRITIEQLDEPKDVLAKRLLKLWRECDNMHHYQPLRAVAESLGIKLPDDDYGEDR